MWRYHALSAFFGGQFARNLQIFNLALPREFPTAASALAVFARNDPFVEIQPSPRRLGTVTVGHDPERLDEETFRELLMPNDTTRFSTMAIVCLIIATYAKPVRAVPVEVFNQVNIGPGLGAGNISNFIIANDFFIDSDASLVGMRIWITDAFNSGDNDIVDNFNGTIGWAIYSDGGSGEPSSLVASGSDAAPIVVDAGFQGGGGVDVAQVDFSIDATLSAGIYWVAVHEGNWLEPYDATPIGWLYSQDGSNNPVGFGNPSVQDPAESAINRIWDTGSQPEYSFALFEVPEPYSITLAALSALGPIALRRRRNRIPRS